MERLPLSIRQLEFARSADEQRYREITRRIKDEAVRKDKENDRKEAEKNEDEVMDLVAMASVGDIADFSQTLDLYDAATCQALLENERLLAIAKAERDEIFEKAHKLPDGTMVFESEDRLRVFTADGVEVDTSVITPEELADWLPTYEQARERADRYDALAEARQEILDYQAQLDEARELLADGKISQADFDELKNSLAEEMPEEVRANLDPENRPALNIDAPNQQAPVAQEAVRPSGNLGRLTFE